jgi:hypothetical protein
MKHLPRFVVWLFREMIKHLFLATLTIGACVACIGTAPEEFEKSVLEEAGLRHLEDVWPKTVDIRFIPVSIGVLIITAAVVLRLFGSKRLFSEGSDSSSAELLSLQSATARDLAQGAKDLIQAFRDQVSHERPSIAPDSTVDSVAQPAARTDLLSREGKTPLIRVYGTDSDDPGEIPDDARRCYEGLFKVTNEQEKYGNILSYLHDAFEEQDESPNRDWAELFFTLTEGASCIGIAFISLYRPLGWCFGNYFGIENGWRKYDQAGRFLDRIELECERVIKNTTSSKGQDRSAKGIVFEVDRYSDSDVRSALAKFDRGGNVHLTKEERDSIRAARRIELYTGRRFGRGLPHRESAGASVDSERRRARHALALVTETGQFVDYIQPAMRRPLKRRRESELWILVYPLSGMNIDTRAPVKSEIYANEALDFLYDHVFPSAYDAEYGPSAEGTAIPGYKDYITHVRQRVERRISGKKLYLARRKDMLSEDARDLLRYREKLDEIVGAL